MVRVYPPDDVVATAVPSSSIMTIAPPRASPDLPVTLPVKTALCAYASPAAAHSNATSATAPAATLTVPRFMRCPLRCEPATRVLLDSDSSDGGPSELSYTAARPHAAQSHPRGCLPVGRACDTL